MLHLNFEQFPVLTTERLILRQLTRDDAPEIFMLRSDDAVNEFIDRQKAIHLDEAIQFISKINNGIAKNEAMYWGIQFKNEARLVGTICYWNIIKEKDCAEIGYELLPAFQGKGIMQEAIETVLRFAFDSLKFSSVVAIAHKENIPSLKVLQRNNFELKNEMEDNMLEYILHVKNFNKV